MIFGETFVSQTLKPILERIEYEESKQCLLLSTNRRGANAEVRIRFRIKLTVKDLILLWELKELLPSLTRLYIEDLYEHRVIKAVPRCLVWEDFRDKLYVLAEDHPWIVGRARARLLKLLSELRVFIWQPPRVPKANRARTPSSAGGSGKTERPSFMPEISNKTAWEDEQQRNYLQEQGRMLEHATHLLAAERKVKMEVEYSKQQPEGGELSAPEESVYPSFLRRQPEVGSPDCKLLDRSPDILERFQIERSELCQFCPRSCQATCAKFKRHSAEGARS
jgi:hypothetical protein